MTIHFFINFNLMKQFFARCIPAILVFSMPIFGWAQDRKDKTPVTFEELYDEPYSVNKLFLGFQPLYGELFATNVNAGYGVEATFYLKDKMDFKAHLRKTYSKSFFDFNRDLSDRNSDVSNQAEVYNYYELGGTYHIKDFDVSSKTKMVLYKKSMKGNRWAAMVPLHAEVPCKVRKIYGARLGTVIWNSTVDVNRALKAQSLTSADLVNDQGQTLFEASGQNSDFNIYSNIYAANIYMGGSMSWFRNVAVSFDKYDEAVDDGLLTLFFDIMFAPSVKLDPIEYQGLSYATTSIKTRSLGFRAGIDGRFNRTLSWSYGGEFGYRPSAQGQGFFAMFKIAFPVYGTNLDYKVESFGK